MCARRRPRGQGWFDGWFPGAGDATWGDQACLGFLAAVLEQHAQTNFLVSVMAKALDLSAQLQPSTPKRPNPAYDDPGGDHDDYVGGYNDEGGDAEDDNADKTSASLRGAGGKPPRSRGQPGPGQVFGGGGWRSAGFAALTHGHLARLCSSSDLAWPSGPGTHGAAPPATAERFFGDLPFANKLGRGGASAKQLSALPSDSSDDGVGWAATNAEESRAGVARKASDADGGLASDESLTF